MHKCSRGRAYSRARIFNLKSMRGAYSRKYSISVIKTEKDRIMRNAFFPSLPHMVTGVCTQPAFTCSGKCRLGIITDVSIILVQMGKT